MNPIERFNYGSGGRDTTLGEQQMLSRGITQAFMPDHFMPHMSDLQMRQFGGSAAGPIRNMNYNTPSLQMAMGAQGTPITPDGMGATNPFLEAQNRKVNAGADFIRMLGELLGGGGGGEGGRGFDPFGLFSPSVGFVPFGQSKNTTPGPQEALALERLNV